MMADDALVEIDGEYLHQTDEAVKLRVEIKKKSQTVWLPKSEIHDYSGFEDYDDLDVDDPVMVEIPEWMAIQKGLV